MKLESIFTPGFQPPQTLATEAFCLFPTTTELHESDYEAVMASREDLRVWSASSWPEDDFTPEQNQIDLALHVEDNEKHAAYGYMIYTLNHKRCLGSVYVNPLAAVSETYQCEPSLTKELSRYDARIDYWIRTSEAQSEVSIAKTLADWFRDGWKISPLFTARPLMQRRLDAYSKLGFQKVADLQARSGEYQLLLFNGRNAKG